MKEAKISLKEVLTKGLVPANNPRNNPMLSSLVGGFVYDNMLLSTELFSTMALPTGIDFIFPYPRLKVLSDVIVLMNDDQIWEWNGTGWTSKISGLPPGVIWSVVDFKAFLWFTNGQVSVIKDAQSGSYSIDANKPFGTCLGNYNGKLFLGSPNTPATGVDITPEPSHAGSSVSPSQSPSSSISPSASISPSISKSISPSKSPSVSPSPSASPSASPSVSPSLSPSSSISPSISKSISPSLSSSLSKSISTSISSSVSPSLSSSLSASISTSVSPSVSISPSISQSISPSGTPVESLSPSISPSISLSVSPSPSVSPSVSLSISPSISPSVSPSASISPSPSPSISASISPSISPSVSPSVSQSLSKSISPSLSKSISPSLSPSISPSVSPSKSPSISRSVSPSSSISPSLSKSISPSVSLSASPSISPSVSPSASISPSAAAYEFADDFDDNRFSWMLVPGITISGGTFNWSVTTQNINFPQGWTFPGTHVIEFTILDYSAGSIQVGLGNAEEGVGYTWSEEFTSNGPKSVELTGTPGCEATSCICIFNTSPFGFTGKIDNFRIY